MSRAAVGDIRVYTAAEAARVMNAPRPQIDAACSSGALFAVDQTPTSTKRTWRILDDDLVIWHRAGRPLVPTDRSP